MTDDEDSGQTNDKEGSNSAYRSRSFPSTTTSGTSRRGSHPLHRSLEARRLVIETLTGVVFEIVVLPDVPVLEIKRRIQQREGREDCFKKQAQGWSLLVLLPESKKRATPSKSQKRKVFSRNFFFRLKVNLLALYVVKFESCSSKTKKGIAELKYIFGRFLVLNGVTIHIGFSPQLSNFYPHWNTFEVVMSFSRQTG